MKIRNFLFTEVINDFLNDFKLFIQSLLFQWTGRQRLDCGDDCLIFLTD